MKRLNPKTGQPFKCGDRRDDGYVFRRYSMSYGIRKDGTYAEQWYTPEAWERARKSSNDLTTTRRAKRSAWLAEIKTKSGCVDCGYNAHGAALDFDHMPGVEKLFSIGNNTNATKKATLAEIAKCEVVCANCHRIRTYQRGMDFTTPAPYGICQNQFAIV